MPGPSSSLQPLEEGVVSPKFSHKLFWTQLHSFASNFPSQIQDTLPTPPPALDLPEWSSVYLKRLSHDLAVAPEHFKDALGLLHCSRRSKPTWLGADEPTYIDAIGVPRGVLDEYKLADQIFKQQKIKKPLGPDLVSPSCLKVCGDQLVPVFTKIFNRSLELSEVPTCFKLTTIIPIPKKAAVSGLNDYRPVALTFVVIKSFERLVLDHLKSVMVPQLDPLEFAFQANRFVLHP
ncbi:uncharacterized protein LOC133500553 isoform X2 [Syngnathoides biaculeatus]|uniref:uncharacterized protein LOC133500553 isoform X2 n=1 Tax=Syngnathoides biaculeatus TaxID=300417 RepID=UPI002ADDF7AA|nr:uncharacterized protein LOC133500553 isoform X2 [Syngnathoides biaculeatus]